MNRAPLTSDEKARFRSLAPNLTFDGLMFLDQLAAKALLAAMLIDDNTLTNAPAFIDTVPSISAPIKSAFDAAFTAARVQPKLANGATVPKSETVAMIAGIAGLLIGGGVAILVVD